MESLQKVITREGYMTMRWISPISLLMAGFVLQTQVIAQSAPSPQEIYVEQLSYNGTGCPNGSVAYDISPDRQALTLMFDDFVVETNRGPLALKHCHLNVDMHVPQGWSFAILDVGFRGFAMLDEGVRARHNTVYLFGSTRFRDSPDSDLVGPYFGDYEHFSEVPLSARNWSGCSDRDSTAPLRIRTRMSLVKSPRNRDAEGMVTVDTFDGAIVQQYNIQWRRCDNGGSSGGGVVSADEATTCGVNLQSPRGDHVRAFTVTSSGSRVSRLREMSQMTRQCMSERGRLERCMPNNRGC